MSVAISWALSDGMDSRKTSSLRWNPLIAKNGVTLAAECCVVVGKFCEGEQNENHGN